MLISIKDRALGVFDIKVSGLALEKLLNIAVKNNLKLRNIRRESYTELYASISVKDYKKLMKKLPAGKYKIEHLKTRGMLPLLYGLRKRIALIASIALLTALAIFASFRIWNINITGCEHLDPQAVLEKLNSYGIRPGMQKDGDFFDECEQKLMQDFQDIKWVNISAKGIDLRVIINEKPKLPELLPKTTPADILAAKDGVVSSVIVLQGQAMVKEGQVVNKGDVLISGQLIFGDVPYRYISASGSVIARVWYSASIEVPMYQMAVFRTGRVSKVRYLDMLGMRIHIDGENSFSNSECVETSEYLMQMGVPVKITTLTYYETVQTRIELTEEEASQNAERMIMDQLSAQLPDDAQLVERNVTRKKSEDNSTLKVSLYIETLEEIGVYTPLLG